jgi:hypothetical protein
MAQKILDIYADECYHNYKYFKLNIKEILNIENLSKEGWLGGYGDCNKLQTDREDGNWWYGKWTI